MYNNSVPLPTIFQVNENIIDKIPFFLKRNNISVNNILVVSGTSSSFQHAEIILNSVSSKSYKIERNDEGAVEELTEFCFLHGIDLLIGEGVDQY